jgi:hypothetical protein
MAFNNSESTMIAVTSHNQIYQLQVRTFRLYTYNHIVN